MVPGEAGAAATAAQASFLPGKVKSRDVYIIPLETMVKKHQGGMHGPVKIDLADDEDAHSALRKIISEVARLPSDNVVRRTLQDSGFELDECTHDQRVTSTANHFTLYTRNSSSGAALVRVKKVDNATFLYCCEQDWELHALEGAAAADCGRKLSDIDSQEVRELNSILAENESVRAPNTFPVICGIKYNLKRGWHDLHERIDTHGRAFTLKRATPKIPARVRGATMSVGKGVLQATYDPRARGEPRLEAPLAEVAFDNASTAHLLSESGNPLLNRWEFCKADEPWQPVSGLGEGGRLDAQGEALDECWVSFVNKDEDDRAEMSPDPWSQALPLKGWVPPEEKGPWTVKFHRQNDSNHKLTYAAGEVTREYVLRRTAIQRRIEVDILVKERAIIVYDNGPGMSAKVLDEFFILGADLEERGRTYTPPPGGPPADRDPGTTRARDDKQQQQTHVVTHNLTAQISHYGLGAKASAMAIVEWRQGDGPNGKAKFPDGGLFVRTSTAHDGPLCREGIFTGDLMREKQAEGKPFNDALTFVDDATKGDIGSSSLKTIATLGKRDKNAPKKPWDDLARHERIKELISNEAAGKSGTVVVIMGVKKEWLEELTLETFDIMARRLAATYHFVLHGLHGLRPDGMSDFVPPKANDAERTKFKQLLEPHSAALPVKGKHNGWTIDMSMRLHRPDGDPIRRDLHKMIDQKSRDDGLFPVPLPLKGHYTDPIAAMQSAAVNKVFRFRAEVKGYRDDPDNLYTMDVVLFYLPRALTGEVWPKLFGDDAGLLPDDTCVTYWEGRRVPMKSARGIKLNRLLEPLTKVQQATDTFTAEQLKRVRGVVFVGKPFVVNKTKQELNTNVEMFLNAAIYNEMSTAATALETDLVFRGDFAEAKTALTWSKKAAEQRKSHFFRNNIGEWISHCSQYDQIFRAKFNAGGQVSVVRLPPKIPVWRDKDGIESIVGFSAYLVREARRELKEADPEKTIKVVTSGQDRDAAVRHDQDRIYASMGDEVWVQSIGPEMTVKVGDVIAFEAGKSLLRGRVNKINAAKSNINADGEDGGDKDWLSIKADATFVVTLEPNDLWQGSERTVKATDVLFLPAGEGLDTELMQEREDSSRQVLFVLPFFRSGAGQKSTTKHASKRHGAPWYDAEDWIKFFGPVNDHACRSAASRDDFCYLECGTVFVDGDDSKYGSHARLPERVVRVLTKSDAIAWNTAVTQAAREAKAAHEAMGSAPGLDASTPEDVPADVRKLMENGRVMFKAPPRIINLTKAKGATPFEVSIPDTKITNAIVAHKEPRAKPGDSETEPAMAEKGGWERGYSFEQLDLCKASTESDPMEYSVWVQVKEKNAQEPTRAKLVLPIQLKLKIDPGLPKQAELVNPMAAVARFGSEIDLCVIVTDENGNPLNAGDIMQDGTIVIEPKPGAPFDFGGTTVFSAAGGGRWQLKGLTITRRAGDGNMDQPRPHEVPSLICWERGGFTVEVLTDPATPANGDAPQHDIEVKPANAPASFHVAPPNSGPFVNHDLIEGFVVKLADEVGFKFALPDDGKLRVRSRVGPAAGEMGDWCPWDVAAHGNSVNVAAHVESSQFAGVQPCRCRIEFDVEVLANSKQYKKVAPRSSEHVHVDILPNPRRLVKLESVPVVSVPAGETASVEFVAHGEDGGVMTDAAVLGEIAAACKVTWTKGGSAVPECSARMVGGVLTTDSPPHDACCVLQYMATAEWGSDSGSVNARNKVQSQKSTLRVEAGPHHKWALEANGDWGRNRIPFTVRATPVDKYGNVCHSLGDAVGDTPKLHLAAATGEPPLLKSGMWDDGVLVYTDVAVSGAPNVEWMVSLDAGGDATTPLKFKLKPGGVDALQLVCNNDVILKSASTKSDAKALATRVEDQLKCLRIDALDADDNFLGEAFDGAVKHSTTGKNFDIKKGSWKGNKKSGDVLWKPGDESVFSLDYGNKKFWFAFKAVKPPPFVKSIEVVSPKGGKLKLQAGDRADFTPESPLRIKLVLNRSIDTGGGGQREISSLNDTIGSMQAAWTSGKGEPRVVSLEQCSPAISDEHNGQSDVIVSFQASFGQVKVAGHNEYSMSLEVPKRQAVSQPKLTRKVDVRVRTGSPARLTVQPNDENKPRRPRSSDGVVQIERGAEVEIVVVDAHGNVVDDSKRPLARVAPDGADVDRCEDIVFKSRIDASELAVKFDGSDQGKSEGEVLQKYILSDPSGNIDGVTVVVSTASAELVALRKEVAATANELGKLWEGAVAEDERELPADWPTDIEADDPQELQSDIETLLGHVKIPVEALQDELDKSAAEPEIDTDLLKIHAEAIVRDVDAAGGNLGRVSKLLRVRVGAGSDVQARLGVLCKLIPRGAIAPVLGADLVLSDDQRQDSEHGTLAISAGVLQPSEAALDKQAKVEKWTKKQGEVACLTHEIVELAAFAVTPDTTRLQCREACRRIFNNEVVLKGDRRKAVAFYKAFVKKFPDRPPPPVLCLKDMSVMDGRGFESPAAAADADADGLGRWPDGVDPDALSKVVRDGAGDDDDDGDKVDVESVKAKLDQVHEIQRQLNDFKARLSKLGKSGSSKSSSTRKRRASGSADAGSAGGAASAKRDKRTPKRPAEDDNESSPRSGKRKRRSGGK